MNWGKKNLIAKLILVIVIILGSYIYFSKSKSIVIDETGKVIGFVNETREWIQDQKFWKLQLSFAQEKYKSCSSPNPSFSSSMKEIDQSLNKNLEDINDLLEEFEIPSERTAKLLRREAERIEKEEEWRMIDQMSEENRLRTIEKLTILIPVIKKELNNSKPTEAIKYLLACIIGLALLFIISAIRNRFNLEKLN